MSKKSSFKTPFNSQYVKRSQTLLESVGQHFNHIFSSLWQKQSWKMLLLVIFEDLGLFVNTLTADNKFSLHNSENTRNQFKSNYLTNKKIFIKYLLFFWKTNYILNIFKRRWPSYFMYFLNYRLRKTLSDKSLKSLVSGHCWTVTLLKGPNTGGVLTAPLLSFFLITLREIVLENMFLEEKIQQSIQMQLSKKQSIFRNFFPHFWNLHQI